MKRSIETVLIVIATGLATAFSAGAQPATGRKDLSKRGVAIFEQLRREPVTFELDVAYAGTDNPRHRLDIYRPKERNADKLPAIVFVHGGGWMHGDKADGVRRLVPFVRTGQYVGISVGYRLSGEAQWPAPVHDCKAAIRWVRANADKYGIDPDKIGVCGPSAGGHLVLMLGASGDLPDLEGTLGPHPGVSSKVACVVNFFGVSEILALAGQPSDIDRTKPNAPEARMLGGPLRGNEAKARAASPVTHVTANDAPVLTVHGDKDRTVPYDQAVRLDAALRKAGVPSYFVTVKGAGHGNIGPAADDRVAAFYGKYLQGKDVEIPTSPIERPAR